ncbi:MAG TPA: MoxR family ATPase [Actinomycetota bacterium]|nr:MoxR family ATPase [Actinomycetota bacterium]
MSEAPTIAATDGRPVTPEQFAAAAETIERELRTVMVGQAALLRDAITCLLAGGHVLLEGVPGLGKTMLVRTLGQVLSLRFSRIQFTPDLMPADIVGTNIIQDTDGGRRFAYQPGPLFANLVLADEVNRATPKTQSAMLEAMQERSVTVGTETRRLPSPFFVLATQNPIELEGTYPLPEAQLDRFLFKILVPFPSAPDLMEIAKRTTGEHSATPKVAADAALLLGMIHLARAVPIADHVLDYAVRLVSATHPDRSTLASVTRYVRFGSSPRGLQALVSAGKVRALLAGRYNVAFEDITAAALPALRHRVLVNFEAEAAGVAADTVVTELLDAVVPEPAR